MKPSPRHRIPPSPRPKQELPADILADLLRSVRHQFCPDVPDKQWYKDQPFLRRVLTWPASWFNKKGVTVSPERYREILIKEIFIPIQQKGHTSVVKYWPGYLLKCIQEHFSHHGETYYAEAKAMRAQTERALMAFRPREGAVPPAPGPDPIETLAAAHRILKTHKHGGARKKKLGSSPAGQPAQPDLL